MGRSLVLAGTTVTALGLLSGCLTGGDGSTGVR